MARLYYPLPITLLLSEVEVLPVTHYSFPVTHYSLLITHSRFIQSLWVQPELGHALEILHCTWLYLRH